MSELTNEQHQVLTEGIEDFNDTLLTQSINLAGQAFNNALRLGCGLLIVPLVIVLVITFIVRGGIDLSALFVYTGAAIMIAIVFSIFVANRAKQLVLNDKYEQDVGPDIARFLAEHQFDRGQFDTVAGTILSADAPLRQYLAAPPPAEATKEEG
jgi:hypothetical protein